MVASAAGAVTRYEQNTGKESSPAMVDMVQAIFEELAANGTWSAASGQVTGTTATQIGPQPLTGGTATDIKFDY